jgi:hypothetical protein
MDIAVCQIVGTNENASVDVKTILEDDSHKVLGYYILQFEKDAFPEDGPNAQYRFWIDNKVYTVGEKAYELTDLNYIPNIRISGGVLLNASVRYCEIEYN